MVHKWLAYFLISLLSLSGVGMPVFTHVCSGMGKTWSALFVQPNACCGGLISHSRRQQCKSHPEANSDCKIKKMPCCENKVSFVALASNYTSQHDRSQVFDWVFPLLGAQRSPIEYGFFRFSPQPICPFSKGPPLRHERSLLIFEQLFLC
jgi:hypothetical protein